jgi:hypothetical protein
MSLQTGFKSRLLTTMAILLANYDDAKDYLSNFEPFVIDLLKGWPAGEEARPKQLCEALSETYHLPRIPINTVTELRNRVRHAGYLVADAAGKCFPNPEALAAVPSLMSGRTKFLDHFDQLAEAILGYAWEVHRRAWTKEEAEAALERFVEEFGIELAMARRAGEVDGHRTLSRKEALAVVHGFARRALEQDDVNLTYLEEVVRASMLANVIYLQNLGSWKPELDRLVVFLDTTVAFRVLGLTDGEVSEAARQMTDLLREFSVPTQIFDHTLVEMQGVLEGVQKRLREVNGNGRTNLEQLAARQGQEVLVHALRQGLGPADIEEFMVDLKERLAARDIAVAAAPEPDHRLPLDQGRLHEILLQMGFKSETQRRKDILSLTAVHAMREGRSQTELGRARAIFVTSNDRLVKASRLWFQEQGKRSIVPQCIGETSFTTQLWLRRPQGRPDVARKFLIAESFAALNPAPELWERYLDRISLRRDRHQITEEQVKALVFSTEAKEGLVEVAHGDPERVDDEAIEEVLARYEERAPAGFAQQLEEARRAIEALREENRAMGEELARRVRRFEGQAHTVASQNREIDAQRQTIAGLQRENAVRLRRERRGARRRRTVRGVAGVAAAAIAIAAVAYLWLSGAIDDPVLRAGVCFLGACLAAGSVAWAAGRGLRWAVTLIVFVGAFTALFFGLVSVAERETPPGSPSAGAAHR